ncbi:unnamed protein product [Didymodactylos carnosus]|uniref:Uncharacterized protein n=1 Tax=Didymodactylos carnosus TaxID=1234261 RepID=A0A8S2DWA1_9BILA|nr:unnamed protein product [Didymodactylos carnosus]CAF3769110.1 unnamed protein product [Didymodactylos carnosus]
MLSALTSPNVGDGVCNSNSSPPPSRIDGDYHSTPKGKYRSWMNEIPEDTIAPISTVTPNAFESLYSNSLSPSPLVCLTDLNRQQFCSTPQVRIVNNPFDPPSSCHLKERLASPSIFKQATTGDEKKSNVFELPAEERAVINPASISENVLQIDATIFNKKLQQRYQQAADDFCHRHLHLPTPAQVPQVTFVVNNGYFTASSNISPWYDLKATPLNRRDLTNQTELLGDFDSMMIRSFTLSSDSASSSSTSNTTNNGDSGNQSQNASLMKQRLFDNLDEEQQPDNQNENENIDKISEEDDDIVCHDLNDFKHEDLDKSFTQEDWLKGLKNNDEHKKYFDS